MDEICNEKWSKWSQKSGTKNGHEKWDVFMCVMFVSLSFHSFKLDFFKNY